MPTSGGLKITSSLRNENSKVPLPYGRERLPHANKPLNNIERIRPSTLRSSPTVILSIPGALFFICLGHISISSTEIGAITLLCLTSLSSSFNWPYRNIVIRRVTLEQRSKNTAHIIYRRHIPTTVGIPKVFHQPFLISEEKPLTIGIKRPFLCYAI